MASRSTERTSAGTTQRTPVEEEDAEEAVPLGGVWMVGAVDEYEDEKTWVMVKDNQLAKSVNAKQNVEGQESVRGARG